MDRGPGDASRDGTANTIQGTAAGPVVQAGVVHGNVYFHAPESAMPPVPRQLPPAPSPFVGRDGELALLDEALARHDPAAPTVLLLHGPAGVGKTALALRWSARLADRFPDGGLYVDLAQPHGEPVAPEDVLGRFLRALGVPPERVPPGLPERTALYRSVTADSALLVLLDNAVSTAQARVLIPSSGRGLAIVTSRRSLSGLLAAGARSVAVAPLGRRAASELLREVIGVRRTREEGAAAAHLADLCGGLPIALCIAAARAASRPRRPLAVLVAELRDERHRLAALSVEGDLSVRSTFDLTYAGLSEPLRAVYLVLGLHPGRTFGTAVVAAAMGVDCRTAHQALDELVDASLVEELDSDRYRMHDLVRLHAAQQAQGEDRSATVRRILEWYLFAAQTAGATLLPARRVLGYEFGAGAAGFVPPPDVDQHVAALDWFERNRPNLVTAVRDAVGRGWSALGYHLADALQPLFLLHTHERESIEVCELGLRAAEACGSRTAEYSMRKWLARTYAHFGRYDDAERLARTSLDEATAGQDRSAEASAWKTIALIRVATGRQEEAAAALRRALEILRVLGRRRDEGLAMIELGRTLSRLGDHREAEVLLVRANQILAGLRPPDPYNAARAMVALGRVRLAEARYDAARDLFEAATSILAGQHADHERAGAHEALAELSSLLGDEEGAARHAAAARALQRVPTQRTDSPD